MDFELDEAQRVIAASAARCSERCARGRCARERGARGRRARGALPAWQALAKAGLLALTLPGRMGGDDLGVLEAAVLLTRSGGRRPRSRPPSASERFPSPGGAGRELADRVLAAARRS